MMKAVIHRATPVPPALCSALAEHVGHNQLGIRVNRGPCPHVAPLLDDFLHAGILHLRAHEGPNFVALEAAHAQIADRSIVVLGTRAPHIAKHV
jgi:hypothetical protein